MKIALFPGTFDPIHQGHIDIIKRASKLFDKLYVAVSHNVDKKESQNINARFAQITKSIDRLNIKNVKVVINNKMTIDLAKKLGCQYIVRSIRDAKDIAYEINIAQNLHIGNNKIETVLLITDSKLKKISSTNVKELIRQKKMIAQRNR
ncbi:phosphopantetheine adenylyltransferase [Bacilli bacterium]|nr:phosphopantetheine adenylyltransferase [Bacilli bacterium]